MPNFQLADITAEGEPTTEDLVEAQRDMECARKIYEHIRSRWPSGYTFRVEAMVRGGVATIKHPLMPPTYGYVVHLSDLATESGWRIVDKAVGLLLEIFDLPRHRFHRDIWREKSRQFRNTKLGIFKREVDLSTGKSRIILPDFIGAK